jgi:hypothetical protein
MTARCMMGLASLVIILVGCATGAPTVESKDRAECKQYASRFAEDPGRMKDACLISRGHRQIYSTVLGEMSWPLISRPAARRPGDGATRAGHSLPSA